MFRKQALFDLSQHALSENNASTLLDKVASTLSQALRVDFVKIMEYLPDEHSFVLRAGVGWSAHLVGREKVHADTGSLASFTLRASRPATASGHVMTLEPIIAEDLTAETRFSPAHFVRDHGAQSGMSVLIHGKHKERPYGVLAAFSAGKRSFREGDAQFLQAAANVAAAALVRIQLEEELVDSGNTLKSLNVSLESRVAERTRELEQSQARLRALATELNLAEQRERKRVATELHDHLAQLLVLGKLKLAQAKRIPSLDPACAGLLSQTDEALSQSLSYTRTLVADLGPSALYEFGLPAAIRWLAEQMQRYDLTVHHHLPEHASTMLPEAQAVLVYQSVRELLINCAKHAHVSEAEVTLHCPGASVLVEVRDHGVGFNVAILTEAQSSTKFGLFSIGERMRALGGSFTVQSTPGAGTAATLTLPIPVEARPESCEGEFNSRPGEGSGWASSRFQPEAKDLTMRVVLVDDHAMIREGLRSVLETYTDIRVVGEAGDGREAVAEVDRLRPSVVIMDINMPHMSGIEATALIKARHPDIKIIGLSVNASEENQHAMHLAGAAVLLTKEAAAEQLHHSIQDVMGRS